MTIEEINQHRDKLLDLVHKNVGTELRKIGLEVINVELIKKEGKDRNQILVSMVMDAGPIPVNKFDIFNPTERIVQRVATVLCGITNSISRGCEVIQIQMFQDQKSCEGTITAVLKNPITGEQYDLILKPQKHQAMLESGWMNKIGIPLESHADYKVNMKFSDGTILEEVNVTDGRNFRLPAEFKGKVIDDVIITG
jgi:hypothetical protein